MRKNNKKTTNDDNYIDGVYIGEWICAKYLELVLIMIVLVTSILMAKSYIDNKKEKTVMYQKELVVETSSCCGTDECEIRDTDNNIYKLYGLVEGAQSLQKGDEIRIYVNANESVKEIEFLNNRGK